MKQAPVVIVGAPRSGTSLLQKILRECPGFGAVPRESQHIWGPHVHPSHNDWDGEGVTRETLADHERVLEIREALSRSAISAAEWRQLSSSRLFNNAFVRRVARLFPSHAVKALTRSKADREADFRLVEKSVHAGLWLPLVDAVLPDARYIHIVRDPRKAVPSIMSGWNEAGRFVSFEVPVNLDIAGYKVAGRQWCFPLPPGWLDYTNEDLLSVACFQWRSINESIGEHFAAMDASRLLRIRLEDLVRSPAAELTHIRTHCAIEDTAYFRQFDHGLPVVNRGPAARAAAPVDQSAIASKLAELMSAYGYE